MVFDDDHLAPFSLPSDPPRKKVMTTWRRRHLCQKQKTNAASATNAVNVEKNILPSNSTYHTEQQYFWTLSIPHLWWAFLQWIGVLFQPKTEPIFLSSLTIVVTLDSMWHSRYVVLLLPPFMQIHQMENSSRKRNHQISRSDTRHLTPPNGITEWNGRERENLFRLLIKFPQIPSAKRGRSIPRSRAILPSVADSDQESGFYASG